MKKLLVFGVIALFLGLAIAPSINANIGELSVDIPQENDTLQLESELQRIRAYIEMQSDEDCDCTSESDSKYPGICFLLFLLYLPILLMILVVPLELKALFVIIGSPIGMLGISLDCSWIDILYPKIQGMINSNYTNEIYKTLSESK